MAPRQKAAEERNFSPKARVRAGERARHAGVRRSKNGEATGVKRTGAVKKGGGKVGRPGIDRLKKGWIFLLLGGGPRRVGGRVPDTNATGPSRDLRHAE